MFFIVLPLNWTYRLGPAGFFSHPILIVRLFKGRPLFSGGAEYVCILFEKSKPRSESIVTQLCLTLQPHEHSSQGP